MSVYQVQEGNTLSAIAAAHKVSQESLLAANPQITNANLIFPHQEIIIPDGALAVSVTSPAERATRTYVVQPGDTLSQIARRHGVSLTRLLQANPQITNPNLIFPGQVITIPPRTTPKDAVSPLNPSDDAAYPFDALRDTPDLFIGFDEISVRCLWLGDRHRIDGRVLTAIVNQESGFKNWRVHHDGTGHGLIGLDDNGLLGPFEQWCGLTFDRGAKARSIPPDLQLKYLAKTIAEFAARFGDEFAAARCWHRGQGRMNDHLGARYESLIRSHILQLYG